MSDYAIVSVDNSSPIRAITGSTAMSLKCMHKYEQITTYIIHTRQAMPTIPHFGDHQLTVKIDEDPGGELRMDIEDAIFRTLGNHPRIIKYHGKSDDITGGLILDTAPNGDVQHYLYDHSDTPLRIRVKWGLQTAEGIVYLHSKHVIWADCTPSNLLLTSDLDILLCDFGGSSISGLRPTVCAGAAYSLPRLEWSADANMDIFSFGSMLFEILTLRPPYAGLTGELNIILLSVI
jgi:serine/threonine protein kinase